jgi:hypothetical protein
VANPTGPPPTINTAKRSMRPPPGMSALASGNDAYASPGFELWPVFIR